MNKLKKVAVSQEASNRKQNLRMSKKISFLQPKEKFIYLAVTLLSKGPFPSVASKVTHMLTKYPAWHQLCLQLAAISAKHTSPDTLTRQTPNLQLT